MDEQAALFLMSRRSSVREPDCSLDGASTCAQASRDTARNSADVPDTVSSLEALRCTDLQMHGVLLGLEEKKDRQVQDMTLERRLDVDAVVKGTHSKGSGSEGSDLCKKCDKKFHCARD